MNTYARTRQERLSELAEKVGSIVKSPEEHVLFMHKRAAGAEGLDVNASDRNALGLMESGAEGGSRTPTSVLDNGF